MPIVDQEKSLAPLGRFAVDLTGQTFERLTVIRWAGRDKKGDLLWLCRCECSNETTVLGRSLTSKMSRSCGCLSRDTTIKTHGRHRLSRTRIYSIWRNMITRCKYPNAAGYSDYGGRGITVCDRWLTFQNFFDDMGAEPFSGCTIERKNSNKGYSKSNCRWASRKEQAANKRTSLKRVRYQGAAWSVLELSEKFGMPYHLIYNRLKAGWSVHRAVTVPLMR